MIEKDKGSANCFGNYIRFTRKRKGLSLSEVSQASGISISYLNRMENGKRKAPSIPILKQLSNALEITIMDLMQRSLETNEPKIKDIREVLLDSNYTIHGKEVPEKVRLIISEIIEHIFSNEWQQEGIDDILQADSGKKIKFLDDLF